MTALILAVKRQASHTLRSPKRLNVLMLLAIAIAAIGAFLLMQEAPQAIEYPKRYLTATPAAVCPGDVFTYPVVIKIDKPDSISYLSESWCRASDGICPDKYDAPRKDKPFVDPYSISTTGKRTVPDDMPPGDWQLRHCNENHSDGVIDVVCYAVDVTVKDCTLP